MSANNASKSQDRRGRPRRATKNLGICTYLELVLLSLSNRAGVEEIDSENLEAKGLVSITDSTSALIFEQHTDDCAVTIAGGATHSCALCLLPSVSRVASVSVPSSGPIKIRFAVVSLDWRLIQLLWSYRCRVASSLSWMIIEGIGRAEQGSERSGIATIIIGLIEFG